PRPVTLTLHPAFRVAPVRRRTFGAFVEHLCRCVYTGIYAPEHPAADEDGFRTAVPALTRELGVSSVRYPGGNSVSAHPLDGGVEGVAPAVVARTRGPGASPVRCPCGHSVSGHRWEDGAGPVVARPACHDLAWHSTGPNAGGLD